MAYDNDMDGVIDDEKLYEYNEDNRIVMQLVNRDLSRFFYDEKGLLVKKTTDYLNDGYVDNHSLYFYDGDGNVIREEDHYGSVDNPPGLIINYLYDVDGTPDRCRYREWLKI
jgi:regulatory protein YycH of two-component signal transduction system YycFG